MNTFGKAIFGDNQFLGVNHSDQAKAKSMFARFSQADAIIEVIGWSYEAGIRDFMFTTHERYDAVFDEIVRSRLFPGLHFTPCLPYAHKYAAAMAEKGAMDVVLATVKTAPKVDFLKAIVTAIYGDFRGLMRLLVQIELAMCKGLPVRGVFLQNILFDLLLGLKATALIENYYSFISHRLGVIPGFITMNHPLAVDVLCNRLGLNKPWLCSNLNSVGFRTNPDQDSVAESFASQRTNNIAMSVFASGATGSSSLAYVLQNPGVRSILFGSSTQQNIQKNVAAITL